MKTGLIANDLPVLLDAARRGQGVINLVRDYATRDLAKGYLIEVLTAYSYALPPLHLYYPRECRCITRGSAGAWCRFVCLAIT